MVVWRGMATAKNYPSPPFLLFGLNTKQKTEDNYINIHIINAFWIDEQTSLPVLRFLLR